MGGSRDIASVLIIPRGPPRSLARPLEAPELQEKKEEKKERGERGKPPGSRLSRKPEEGGAALSPGPAAT
ncbi:hypothetical protein NDU88_007412 [Pleurodeles waltl]|uniref:Uncharacterized protein n=1 Tax=Pleurodeles waltl TaxID=8319 RepID=A0AAV7N698_PLEWA|nr:hypothetical protein NDU88_007412 [Pleurodeles waltl]